MGQARRFETLRCEGGGTEGACCGVVLLLSELHDLVNVGVYDTLHDDKCETSLTMSSLRPCPPMLLPMARGALPAWGMRNRML
jgi:hypothetical protein